MPDGVPSDRIGPHRHRPGIQYGSGRWCCVQELSDRKEPHKINIPLTGFLNFSGGEVVLGIGIGQNYICYNSRQIGTDFTFSHKPKSDYSHQQDIPYD